MATEVESEAVQSDPRRDAVAVAAAAGQSRTPQKLPTDVENEALAWFLSDEEIAMEKVMNVNIGRDDAPRWVDWTITAISGEQIRQARKMAEEKRSRKGTRDGSQPEVDTTEANLRIVVAGSVSPDLRAAAKQKGAPDHPDGDLAATQLLRHRLRHKPGLVDQLAGGILEISGYDEDDVVEHAAGKVSP